ncbi:MAG: glycoside hydrolase, partial [Anaerolineae bacterium]|nr:glycoside hydrolase [Anaerolineae bacterium]
MGYFISLLLLLGLLPGAVVSAQETPVGAVDSGVYPNRLAEWGVSQDEIDARIEAVWQQLFYGDDDTQR